MRWLYCTISGIFWKEFTRMCHLQFFPPTSSLWCFSVFFHLVQQGQFRCLKLFYFSAQWRVRAPVNTVDIMQVVGWLLGAAQLQHLHLFCPEGMLHVDTKTAVTLLQLAVCVVSVSLVMCLLVGSGRSDSQRRVLSFQLQFRGCISPSKVLIALVCKSLSLNNSTVFPQGNMTRRRFCVSATVPAGFMRHTVRLLQQYVHCADRVVVST